MKNLSEKFAKDFNLLGNTNQSPQFIKALQEAAKIGFVAGFEAAQHQLERDAVSCECQQPLVDMRRYGVHCGFCKKQLRPSTS